ncbi:hypothetical protein ATY81_00635 [Rhizobium sp. R72]|nr:hypothetical protein ATY81_00635 [Rhizobium sp. R72]OWW05592.1 hypothetical protein ATY80_00635 [Rhizobium sp. R711]
MLCSAISVGSLPDDVVVVEAKGNLADRPPAVQLEANVITHHKNIGFGLLLLRNSWRGQRRCQ